jgi:hypothetical protein
LIEVLDLPSGSEDVLEHCLSLSAVRISHTTQIRDAEHSHEIAFADGLTVNIPNARWLGDGHGT